MNQRHGAVKARTVHSVIDYEFYQNRARRLREDARPGSIGDFVYRTVTGVTPAQIQGGFQPQFGYC